MFSKLIKLLSSTVLLAISASASLAGPAVVPHPKSENTVAVRSFKDQELVREFKDPASIKNIQDIFARAKKVGDTASRLKEPTHKINFSDSWLVDLKSGEIGVLSKAITTVYQLEPEDLKTLQQLLQKDTTR